MLDSIQIKNFAIIDSLQVEFGSGMSALTGETGAGKSILLDAIKLAAGDRASNDSIRSGAERAEVCVSFNLDDCESAQIWLQENEMLAGDDCVLRRIVLDSGRSRAFINGYQATLAQLRALCDRLVDIHGQHEHQSLQVAAVQRQLLDSYIGEPDLLNEVASKYAALRDMETRLENARKGAYEREQRIDLLRLYCDELNQLNPVESEYPQLENEYKRLSNAGELIYKSADLLEQLYENDDSNVQSILGNCAQQLDSLRRTDNTLDSSHELISGALIQVQEAITELRDYRDAIELDDARLSSLNERIALYQGLARKHRVELEQLPALALQLNEELEGLQGDGFDIDRLQADLEKLLQDYQFSAGELSVKRQNIAATLSTQITAVMQQLGMDGGHFVIDVQTQQPPSQSGVDKISYLVSANPGQPPKPLAKVASGGELSRISLAIQVIMSESSQIPTLIFDEVDSGVGGRVAEIVGKKLRLLGGERQVFCVTHLPQVASRAHHHFRVEKQSSDNQTSTGILALDEEERLEEVARMLGGITITDQTRAHASEMIAMND